MDLYSKTSKKVYLQFTKTKIKFLGEVAISGLNCKE